MLSAYTTAPRRQSPTDATGGKLLYVRSRIQLTPARPGTTLRLHECMPTARRLLQASDAAAACAAVERRRFCLAAGLCMPQGGVLHTAGAAATHGGVPRPRRLTHVPQLDAAIRGSCR